MILKNMEKKTIVTHKSPDLDSCVAIWILKRFIFPKHHFDYIFVDVGDKVENIHNAIHVDTGGIDYDHHDSNAMISSASLVYSKNNLKDKALSRIVDFSVKVDHGRISKKERHFMNIVNALDGLRSNDSLLTLNAALTLLDGIYNSNKMELKAKDEFKQGIFFNSIFGSGLGFNSENSHLRKLVYDNGYDIFLFKDQQTGFSGFKADGFSEIDFSNLFNHFRQIEPEADWFLHSSNQLLLCGSSKAPLKRQTQFSLNQLINIIEKYAKK